MLDAIFPSGKALTSNFRRLDIPGNYLTFFAVGVGELAGLEMEFDEVASWWLGFESSRLK